MTQAEQLAAQAASWQAAGRPDMAAQLYTAALDQDPSKYAVRMQLAECLVYLGQAEQAAEQYLMVAQAYAARGRHQECLAICERILTVAPQAFVYMSVGPMIRRIGRHARPLCAKAAELHLAAGRQTDGLQILRLGAELDPHNPDVRRQLARIYLGRHMNREAVEALADAGNLLLQAKRFKDYIEVARQILTIQPNELETLRELPRAYLELGRPHEAVRALGALTKASPGDIAGYEILAHAFAVIGRTEKSLLVLERLVEQLGATGQHDQADAILNHAKYWRPKDASFSSSLKAMEVPRAKPAPSNAPPPPPAPEGTVVLSLADLVLEERKPHTPAAPVHEDSAVHLVEAEGTLMLNLEDLVMEEAPAQPAAPPPPQEDSVPDQATVSLDGSALRSALLHDMKKDAAEESSGEPEPEPPADNHAERPTLRDIPVITDDDDGPMSQTLTNPNLSMSALIYDEDEEPDPATLLHIKPLTAEDIARAQQQQAEAEAEAKTPPMGGPVAPQPITPPPGAPPPPPAAVPSPPPAVPSPPPAAPSPPAPPSQGEEAPTMAHLRPVTAADIARALAGNKAAPDPEDAPTLPPAHHQVAEDDEATMLKMDALTPEAIERAMAEQRAKNKS